MANIALDDRALVRLEGADTRAFLHRILTCDMGALGPDGALYGALLTPQGKVLADFFLIEERDIKEGKQTILCDLPASLVASVIQRLLLYRLRADVRIEAAPDLAVQLLPDDTPASDTALAVYADPRHAGLGTRQIVRRADSPPALHDPDWLLRRRIALGIPEGGVDFAYGEAFPHEADLDRLGAISLTKGCYVGQEVAARITHRGSVRRRSLRVHLSGTGARTGDPVMRGDVALGTMGSVHEREGLASLRLDRLDDAPDMPITIGDAGSIIVTLADAASAGEA